MCHFQFNGGPIRDIFHRFQYAPASYERSLMLHHGAIESLEASVRCQILSDSGSIITYRTKLQHLPFHQSSISVFKKII